MPEHEVQVHLVFDAWQDADIPALSKGNRLRAELAAVTASITVTRAQRVIPLTVTFDIYRSRRAYWPRRVWPVRRAGYGAGTGGWCTQGW